MAFSMRSLHWLLLPTLAISSNIQAGNEVYYAWISGQIEITEQETLRGWRTKLMEDLQMMFVSGETGEPTAETTGIIEQIVREQVIEIVSSGRGLLPLA